IAERRGPVPALASGCNVYELTSAGRDCSIRRNSGTTGGMAVSRMAGRRHAAAARRLLSGLLAVLLLVPVVLSSSAGAPPPGSGGASTAAETNKAPKVTKQPASVTVEEGQSASFIT